MVFRGEIMRTSGYITCLLSIHTISPVVNIRLAHLFTMYTTLLIFAYARMWSVTIYIYFFKVLKCFSSACSTYSSKYICSILELLLGNILRVTYLLFAVLVCQAEAFHSFNMRERVMEAE